MYDILTINTMGYGGRAPLARDGLGVFGQAGQRVADLCTPVFAFMLGNQADPGLHHHGYPLDVGNAGVLPAQARRRPVFRGRLELAGQIREPTILQSNVLRLQG